ncbi:cysteine-rich repeat secretory protein 38-like [Salvia divinorum]|uniref:Cysteine-rich repeat secretory protein 38-like n=1 Tax=Salvia divinorum TaxID=28513 RepID=A0ABD1I0Z4_SALDI
MASSHISLSLLTLSLSLLIQTTLSLDPLFTICPTSQNYTANTPYSASLKTTLSQLYLKTPPTGFGQAVSGLPGARAYGLALCRGDVSAKDCAACVAEAGLAATSRCPSSKAAVVWYDNCYLKYSDSDFFGKIDDRNRFYMWNLRNVSGDGFSQKARDLLSELGGEASESKKMFASGEVEFDGIGKIYGMAQCSRDLSKADCKKCVDDGVGELPLCCEGREGGRVVGGSCSIRYEIYPFLYL